MTVDEKGLEAAVEAVMRFGTHSRLRASALAKECILAYESAKSAEGAVDGAIVVEQPYHGGRYIIAYKGGSLTGWSYPSAEAAQAELDAICAALVLPAIERARVEERERERERCAKVAEDCADLIGRIMAAGWRGNPHMSGDDRNFMNGSQRRKHDDQSLAAAEHTAAAIRKG